jgi:cytochrome P450
MSDTVVFNPFDPAFRVDPYPTYERLLAESPVFETPLGQAFARWSDCVAILRDPRSSSDQRNSQMFQMMSATLSADEREAMEGTRPFLFLDPPDHTRLRGLVQKAFTPRTVEALRPRIVEVVDELLADIAAKGEMEVIEDFAYPLPVKIISEMLGVPAEDHETFKGWSAALASSLDPDLGLPAEALEERRKVGEEFGEYFRGLIGQRRRQPGDDLLSALVAAEDGGDVLAEDELVTTCILLLVAGHETTVNLIANGTLALLRHPDQLARLRSEPTLVKPAVEEVLRYDPPVQLTARVALDDIEVGGTTISKGTMALVLLAAANRDPDQFSHPTTFDVARSDNRHVAFGFGAHFCLGAPLARAEGQIALQAVAERFVDPHLMVDEPQYKENLVLRGLHALPVGFAGIR